MKSINEKVMKIVFLGSGLHFCAGRCINLYLLIRKRNSGNGENRSARFPVWNEVETI